MGSSDQTLPAAGAGAATPGRTLASSWSRRTPVALPLLIGHRGASALEPENSLAAFERARRDGADGVELDVLRCSTGEVVVFHDDDLVRLGGRSDRIDALSLAEVRAVRLASGASIPTLEEVFEACGESLLINVELKASGIDGREIRVLVEEVANAISRAGGGAAGGRNLAERVLVSSFNPRAVLAWRRRARGSHAGLLFERDAPLPLRRAWALPWLRAFSVHPESVLCTPAAVRAWQRRGYRVNVWTVDDPEELRRFAAMGVDGLITNDPARSRRLLTVG